MLYLLEKNRNLIPILVASVKIIFERSSSLVNLFIALAIDTNMASKAVRKSKNSPSGHDHARPNSVILSILPTWLISYGELTRIHKPVGVIHLYTPCAYGSLLAASLADPIIAPSELIATCLILFIGSIVSRSAACSWNDTADQDLDQKVSRTRLRPIARGAVSTRGANVCTCSLLLAFLALHSILPILSVRSATLPCVYYSAPFLIAAGVYPFLKRFTHYPQVMLGFALSWGVVMAFPALGLQLFTSQTREVAAGCMVISTIAWTVLNDTIYAFQDVEDDLKVGIMSVAVRYKDNPKYLFGGLAIIQICSLMLTGVVIRAGPGFFVCAFFVSGVLAMLIRNVNLQDKENCAWWFQRGCHSIGALTVCCFLSEYLRRKQ